MRREVILLRAVTDSREGWLVMERNEFLERMDLETWAVDQVLIGTVLLARDPPREAN
jgi:hypothetical protein